MKRHYSSFKKVKKGPIVVFVKCHYKSYSYKGLQLAFVKHHHRSFFLLYLLLNKKLNPKKKKKKKTEIKSAYSGGCQTPL